MEIQTYDGEILLLGDFRAYVNEYYGDEDPDLRAEVDRIYESMAQDGELTFEAANGCYMFFSGTDVPGEIAKRLGATRTEFQSAVNVENNTIEDPMVLIAYGDSRTIGLVWWNVGYWSPKSAPDYVVDLDSGNDTFYLLDMLGHEFITCQSCDFRWERWTHSTGWTDQDGTPDDPAERAERDGASCTKCGGKLIASISYGETMQSSEIPWVKADAEVGV